MSRRDQRGQVTVMLVIFAVCLLLAISAVIDISAGYLRRQAVTNLADGARLPQPTPLPRQGSTPTPTPSSSRSTRRPRQRQWRTT